MCSLIYFVLRSSYIFAKVCGRSCAKFMGIGIKDDSHPALTLQQVVYLLFGGCLHLFYVCAHFGHIRPLISTNTNTDWVKIERGKKTNQLEKNSPQNLVWITALVCIWLFPDHFAQISDWLYCKRVFRSVPFAFLLSLHFRFVKPHTTRFLPYNCSNPQYKLFRWRSDLYFYTRPRSNYVELVHATTDTRKPTKVGLSQATCWPVALCTPLSSLMTPWTQIGIQSRTALLIFSVKIWLTHRAGLIQIHWGPAP